MSKTDSTQGLTAFASGGITAMRAVAWARKQDLLPHPADMACVDCGAPASVYDHRDYNKPLQVVPVCRPCNAKRGAAIPSSRDADPPTPLQTEASGYVLSKHGIAPVSFVLFDFYPRKKRARG